MEQDGKSKIKEKLQELTAVIKEETAAETREIKDELMESLNQMKATVDKSWQGIEATTKEKLAQAADGVMGKIGKTQDIVGENLKDVIGDLEGKALKLQYTLEEKYSQGKAKKDDIVVKTADSLIDAIKKIKTSLHSEGGKED